MKEPTVHIKNESKELMEVGKKQRNRINSPKKNNHVTVDKEVHEKEHSAIKRKNGPGNHL